MSFANVHTIVIWDKDCWVGGVPEHFAARGPSLRVHVHEGGHEVNAVLASVSEQFSVGLGGAISNMTDET